MKLKVLAIFLYKFSTGVLTLFLYSRNHNAEEIQLILQKVNLDKLTVSGIVLVWKTATPCLALRSFETQAK